MQKKKAITIVNQQALEKVIIETIQYFKQILIQYEITAANGHVI